MSRTLIDGLWFFGGNRQRGIGKYLDYYFRKVCTIPPEDRWWLVPQQASDIAVNKLLELYGGQSFEIDLELSGQRQRELMERWFEQKQVESVFISSPFERPRSLLDFSTLFREKSLKTTAMIFDLLPLQFRQEILEKWSLDDQEQYERRVQRLSQIQEILAISPQAKQQLITFSQIPADSIEVIRFGLSPTWLSLPHNWHRKEKKGSIYVLTISGGEWRKNLDGTLKYFAKRWKGKKAQLRIICRLSAAEIVHLHILATRLGILRQLRYLGQVSDSRKWQELGSAQVFLFLSQGEGLGIPLLEAKKAQVPKIILSKELADAGFGRMIGEHEVAETEKAKV